MIFSSLKTGIALTLRNKVMVTIYYLANLIFGIVLMVPFYTAISSIIGNSQLGEKLAGRMDMDFFFEFMAKQNVTMNMMRSLILIVAGIYWLFGLFLSGGVFSVFLSGEKYSYSTFLTGSVKYFGRFFRLFLLSLPVFGIFYCFQFIENAIQRLAFGSDPYQNIVFWGAWIRLGLGYIGILLFYLVLDYARIYIISTDEHKVRRALWQSVRFTFGNFFQTFSITFIIFLVGIIILIIYNPIADSLHAPNALIILILLIVQQAYIFLRMLLKLTLYSSQAKLYNTLTHQKELTEPPIENV